jgi:hypothetical protein
MPLDKSFRTQTNPMVLLLTSGAPNKVMGASDIAPQNFNDFRTILVAMGLT